MNKILKGTIEVGQKYRFENIDGEFTDLLSKGVGFVDQYMAVTNHIAKKHLSMMSVDESKSSLTDFEQNDDGSWNFEINAIYPVEYEDLKSKHSDETLAGKRVVEMINKYVGIRDNYASRFMDYDEVKPDAFEEIHFDFDTIDKESDLSYQI